MATTKTYVSIICLLVTVVAIFEAQALTPSSSQTHFSKFSRPKLADLHESVKSSMAQAQAARSVVYNIIGMSNHRVEKTPTPSAVSDCAELLDDSIEQLGKVVNGGGDEDDVHTWLSAALTNQETCLDSLKEEKSTGSAIKVDDVARNLSRSISDSLAQFVSTKKTKSGSGGGGRKLLSDKFPEWVDRRLLEASVEEIGARFVVAKDGSGTHKTIGEALDEMVASLDDDDEGGGGGGKTVIHVTAGTYHENIDIPTKRKNVMLIGDGKGKSVVVGSRSNEGGWSTFKTATVAAMGDGFIARDITIVNSAGIDKHQAVALRVGSDRSVIYRCSIQGYQDTLYAHSKRQFYRETDISGTVDFMFGNAAAVFQSCSIHALRPRASNHVNFVTAHGRTDPNQNTGFSIHNSRVDAAESGRRTYLGRPWKQYARVVFMESFLDGGVHPAGWSPWSGGFALKTLFYGEYKNSGPGSALSARVTWPTYHASMTSTQAQSFTVGGFISGNQWIPSTGASFDSGLMG